MREFGLKRRVFLVDLFDRGGLGPAAKFQSKGLQHGRRRDGVDLHAAVSQVLDKARHAKALGQTRGKIAKAHSLDNPADVITLRDSLFVHGLLSPVTQRGDSSRGAERAKL